METLSVNIIGYLFCGGVGAGAIVAWLLRRWCFAKGLDENVSVRQFRRSDPWVLGVAECALAIGCLLLLVDLANPDAALLLFVRPSATPISIGAIALAVLMASVFPLFVGALRPGLAKRGFVGAKIALEVFGGCAALVVAAYTAVLLNLMGHVALWGTPLLVPLFLVSSVSSGFAVLVVADCLAEIPNDRATRKLRRRCEKFDGALIVIEGILLALLLGVALPRSLSGEASLVLFVEGAIAPVFWIALVAAGLVLPLFLGFAERFVPEHGREISLAGALLVLAGCLALRWCVVSAGVPMIDVAAPML